MHEKIIDHIYYFLWDVVSHPFPNVNARLVKRRLSKGTDGKS